MLSNVSQIILSFPLETVVDISGDPEVVAQIVKRLDGLKITIVKQYFSGGSDV